MAQASQDELATGSSAQPQTSNVSQPGAAVPSDSQVSQPGQAPADAAASGVSAAPGQADSAAAPDAGPGAAGAAGADAAQVDEKSSDLPPKTDVTLRLKGTPEYNAFPHTKESDKFYFMASVKASYFREKDRAPIDLCCVIDESSSMSGARIDLVKETVTFVLRNLTNQDRFGIVGYGSNATTRLALTKMDETGKKQAKSIVDSIRANGMTALCEGLEGGINMMRNRNKEVANQIASVMLFTDGQANVGPATATGIQAKISGIKVKQPALQPLQPMFQIANMPNMQNVANVPNLPNLANVGNVGNVANVPNLPTVPEKEKKKETQDDEKNKESNGTNEGSKDTSLPCTIYTFGFGANHNESLLEGLAEWGRGQYTFIENTDTIGEIFAECLGGLISIVGRELKVKVAGLNDVLINRCISQGGYEVIESKPKLEYTINIPDIQSEETRDLVFEVTLPKLDQKREEWPMAQISCEYTNVAKKKRETLSIIANINRCGENDEIGERNDELDAQRNRLFASEAMDIADKMAERGDLTNARKVLSEAKQKIQNSETYRKQKKGYYSYAQNLVSDMDDVTKDLANKQSYSSAGGKKLKMSKKAHAMQRSVHSSNYASQSSYSTNSKMSMISKFKH